MDENEKSRDEKFVKEINEVVKCLNGKTLSHSLLILKYVTDEIKSTSIVKSKD